MGYGTWSAETYSRVTRAKIDSGTDFAYTSHARMTGSYKQHPLLNVKNDDGTAKLYGPTLNASNSYGGIIH